MAAESEEQICKKEVSLLIGGEEISVPTELLEDEDVFSHVMSRDTWDNVLTESDREHLSKFLPQELSNEQKESTITDLFGGVAFKFGSNPIKESWDKVSGGDYVRDISCLKDKLKLLKYQLYQQNMKYYHLSLMQDVLLSKRHIMYSALDNGSLDNLEVYDINKLTKKRKGIWTKTESKYRKILEECSKEGDFEFSSEDEEATPTEQEPVFTEEEFQKLLKKHKKRRRMKKLDPDLNTSGITLASITGTSSSVNIKTELLLPPPSINIKQEKTPPPPVTPSLKATTPKSKPHPQIIPQPVVKDVKKWEGLFYGRGCVYEVYVEPEKLKTDKLAPIILDGPLPSNQYMSFFSIIKKSFQSLPDNKGDIYKVTEMVEVYLESPDCQSCSWLPLQSDWSELTLSAICYLGGEVGAVSSFDPLPHFYPVIEFRDRIDHWRWIGNHRDSEPELLILYNHWYSNIDRALVVVDYTDYDPLPPLISTTASVRASKHHEIERFQDLEQQRYSDPHKAFTYKVHGYEASVGPVKGAKTVVKKDNPKARGHALLKQERPNCVTILSLVRDACSRLPNGEGTRLDLCILLRDSQFISDNVTNSQLNNAVSGALDRLHYEKDPCVRYISSKKIWLYLHRNRTEEEFEHISWAVEAANKNKKIIQTRAKQTPKILLRDADGQITDISPSPWSSADNKVTSGSSTLSIKPPVASHRSPRSRQSGGGTGGGGARGGGARGGGRGSKTSRSRKTFVKAPPPVGGSSQSNIESDTEIELPFLPTTVHKDQDDINYDSDATSDDIQLPKGGVAFQPQATPIPRLISVYDFHAPSSGGGGAWGTTSDESDSDSD
ncbi:PREDICTED: nuclear factor related to kappa-B-binding protein-like [Amphimedon queenslandica]|uniref:DEUBAD domain-containing protein n=1 Tax=Amphimedon queenslandica TaxID=400682 RepID=A0A1X7UUM8_AMPQE|nr:PREDICTED: nuclear factor related to kappa-B-binding protein-like [Amphimedon queenslandica]|eukprot:XP_003386786.1 PREDICTED: nuclear factor related to kappa-B-binding protein-like [Amphimedon queenslandica]